MNTQIKDTHNRSPSNIPERPQVSVYIATSIDGFIAKENDELDWLENINPPGCHEPLKI